MFFFLLLFFLTVRSQSSIKDNYNICLGFVLLLYAKTRFVFNI